MDIGFVATIVGAILAVLALPFSYYIGRRNRQRPDLRYVRDFDVLMSPEDGLAGGNLVLSVNGNDIKSISRTYVALFNKNGDSVRGSDIIATDPLRLTVQDDDSILQARVISRSRPQCAFDLKSDESDTKAVQVTFEFLDARDGVIVEVLHQGSKPVAIEGTIVGANFRDKGTAVMTPHALRVVAAKTLLARAKLLLSGGKARRALIAFALMLVMMSVMGYFLIDLLSNQATAPISIEGLDLTTLDGQRQFLTQASNAKLWSYKVNDLWTVMGLWFAIPLLGLLFLISYLSSPAIPTSITHDIVEEETSTQEA